jgi:hypothetical protein
MAFVQQQLSAPPYLVGPDQTAVTLNAEIVRDLTDDAWLKAQISSSEGWDQSHGGRSRGSQALASWMQQARTPMVLDDDQVYVGWSEYWSSLITLRSLGGRRALTGTAQGNKNSKGGRLGAADSFGFALSEVSVALAAGTAPVGVDIECIPLSSLAKNGITQQLGLLQDDILYNLSLLCKNVLEPVKAKYPGIVVASGFRQVNTGIGPHERGQAADIIIPSAADTLLYEVADFIVKTLQFDQVILNYSMRRSPWIHVSFVSTGLRRTALTRDFDDTFHSGLFLITPKTGEDRAAALREQIEYRDKIDAELQIVEKRQLALNPDIVIGDATAPGMGSAGEDAASGGGDHGEPDGTVPNEMSIVQSVFDALGPGGVAWDFTTHDGGGAFVEAVVSALPGEWGHVGKSGGQTMANGHAVDAIAYKSPTPLYNGKWFQVIDIISSVGSATGSPQWYPVGAPVGDTPDGELGVNGPWYR